MAIDTAQKRHAVPGVGRPFMRSQLPVAAKNAGWRASVGLSFTGLLEAVEEEEEVEEEVEAVLGGGGPAIHTSFRPLPDFRDERKRDVDVTVALLMLLSE